MKVPFVDLKLQYSSIKSEIRAAMDDVLDNTAYILGKSVANFESSFAEKHNVKFCSGVSSGTDGNHLVLWALGVGHGDEVIIPADTFIATAWGATLCGATPVFVDVHPESYNLDPVKVAAAVTPKTKAIVAVHLYGQPADIDAINSELFNIGFLLKTRRNDSGAEECPGVFVHKETGQVIYLVEDCAQSHLSEYKSQKVGGLSAAASFSFYPGKNLGTYGEGGAVCTNNEDLAKKFKMMREHGSHQKYMHLMYGHNYRMEGIQGAVLGVKLNYLEKWTQGRRQAAEWYKKYLGDCKYVVLPKEMEGNKHVYHLYVVRIKNSEVRSQKDIKEIQNSELKTQISRENSSQNSELKTLNSSRDDLMKYLGEKDIASGLHYPIPLHLQPCFEHLGYKRGDMPVTENIADTCLSLPMFPELTEDQVKYVCDSIKQYFS